MSSTDYNVIIELESTDDIDGELLEGFAAYHPATGRGTSGRVQLIITVPARDFVQVMQTTAALVAQSINAPIATVEYMRTDEFDRKLGDIPIPELVSVTQAAEKLGVSRQAVLQRLDTGSLQGEKVGGTWVVAASAVESALEHAVRLGRSIDAETRSMDVSH